MQLERRKFCDVIFTVGKELGLECDVVRAAAFFFQRAAGRLVGDFRLDPWLLAVTCLHLAAKARSVSVKLRSLFSLCEMLRTGDEDLVGDLTLKRYWEVRTEVFVLEEKLLLALDFDVSCPPYDNLAMELAVICALTGDELLYAIRCLNDAFASEPPSSPRASYSQ
eukprot:Polyplicarium_translucidae@DN0_c0_g1_i2.p1